ncbi:hypothetical protein H4Q32_023871 [Labeo rohita]|uniref:Uncharacterized protein n=2 Tax=Labeo rohita TaxID=84645 RepID=A0ABQ8L9Y1_LABRO|nr:hypothetical protein H4Q32_023871 [Labeo rohita]
MFTAVFSGECE